MFWDKRAEKILSKADFASGGNVGDGGFGGFGDPSGDFGGFGNASTGTGIAGGISGGDNRGYTFPVTTVTADPEGDTAYGGWGSASAMAAGETSDSLGETIGNMVAQGSLTADQANQVIANSNLGFTDTVALNYSAAMASMPTALSKGLSLIGMPVARGVGLAAIGSALSGQGMLGGSIGDGVEGGDGHYEALITKGQQYAQDNNLSSEEIISMSKNGSTTITNKNGTTTTINPDGSTMVTSTNGATTTTNLDGSTTVVETDGVSTDYDVSGNEQRFTYGGYDGNRQLFDEFANEVFDTAYGDYEKQVADLTASTDTANQSYQDSLQALQDSQAEFDKRSVVNTRRSNSVLDQLGTEARGYNTNYTDTMNQATGKQNSLLDGLIGELRANNSMSPVSFGLGNDTVSFIPRANRATQQQIANYGQDQYDNSTGTADNVNKSNQSLLDTLEGFNTSKFDRNAATAENIFGSNKTLFDAGRFTTDSIHGNNKNLINNGTAQQKYLELLAQLAQTENNMYANDQGIATENRRVDIASDANDVTWLDGVKVAGAIGSNWDKISDAGEEVLSWFSS